MSRKILNATNDLIFKMVFGNSKNISILIDFLKSVLDIPHDDYDELIIVDPNLRIEREKDKLGILDLKLKTKTKKTIDIEIQLLEMDAMVNRILFYNSKMINEQISSSENYDVIKKVINIIILNYNLITDSKKYRHKYMYHDIEDNSLLTDLSEIHVLELKKLPKESDNTDLYDWLSFFKATKKEELNMLKEKNPEISKAVVILERLSEDEQTVLLAEAREKALRDENTRLKGAEEKGLQKGIELGIEQGKKQESIDIAKKLLKLEIDIEKIVLSTSLTKEEIQNLKN